MLKFKLLTIFFIKICFVAYSQGSYNKQPAVVVHDSLINDLLELHIRSNKQNQSLNGYRVHIYTDTGIRSKVRTENEQATFDEKYPEVASYITYMEPNYRIRVGDFRTRLDATRFLRKIQRDYPHAYVIRENINFPALEIFAEKEIDEEDEHEDTDEPEDTDEQEDLDELEDESR